MSDFDEVPGQRDRHTIDLRRTRDHIRACLLDQLRPLLKWVFPNGAAHGRKFHVGNLQGDPGRSLEVELEGEKAGLWMDHATGESGDVFHLVAVREGLDVRRDFPQVLVAAERWLGSDWQALETDPSRQRPRRNPKKENLGRPTAKWDYRSEDGKLLAQVYRYDPPTGKEYRPRDVIRGVWRAPKVRPLYDLPGLRTAQTVVLVEGEKCAEALINIGICATTAMQGAKAPVEKNDWSPLKDKEILIWPDNDKPGWEYAHCASQAVLAAGAASCFILCPPAEKPAGWDAADAIADGFDTRGFLAAGERMPVERAVEATPPPDVLAGVDWSTEDGLATAFTRRYCKDWRYCALWGKWLVWTGVRWNPDQVLFVMHLSRGVCRAASQRAGSVRIKAKLAGSSTIAAVERIARSDPGHASTTEEWDADPWLLNTPGSVVDLRTGHRRCHRREDRMTKIATATPQGDCPLWRRFLGEITGGDPDLQDYLARVVGYALTGITSEHALFFLFGTGANGKSVFVTTIATILGDYATNAPMDTFMDTRSDRHPTDLAGLRGARFVSSIETEQGRRWAESKLKAITGGDKISARFMRQDFFEFVPQFKLVIAGNHKPAIRNVDEAMQRRLHLIPFTVTIPPEKRDQRLPDKLLKERDGILAWAVQGCLDWQRIGLKPPKCVLEATTEYFEAEDAIGRWIEERCFTEANTKTLVSDLFADWKEWAERAGEYVGSIKRFSELLTNRKFDKCRLHGGSRGFAGISLRPNPFATYGDRDK